MKAIALTVVLAGLAGTASAQVLASDDFSYTGALSANGWLGGPQAGQNPIMSDGAVATLEHGPLGEDLFLPFGPLGYTDTTYLHIDLEVPSGNPVNPGEDFVFLSDGGFAVHAITSVFSPSGAGDFRLGITADTLSSGAMWPSDLSFDTPYSIVISFDAATNVSTLWVDPVDMTSSSVSDTGAFSSAIADCFLLQGTAYAGFMEVDNLIVGRTFGDVVPPSGGPTTYCTGKTNSLGCVPFISSTGTPSATSTSPFRVIGNDAVPGEVGFILYSFQKANLNFHGGKLCVKAPFTRWLPPKVANSNGTPPCAGMLKRNFNNRIQAGVDPLLTAGQTVVTQWIQRDPTEPAGFGDSLTDGLRFTIAP